MTFARLAGLALVLASSLHAASVSGPTINNPTINEGGSVTVAGEARGTGANITVSTDWGDGSAASVQVLPNTSQVWQSFNATISATSSGVNNLTRGAIVGSTGTSAELEFYMASNSLGVTRSANFGANGTGAYNAGVHPTSATTSAGHWRLPGGQDGSFDCYVAMSAIARGTDAGETGALPGGINNVFDLQFHPSVNLDQPHVIAFTAPTTGLYEITNFAARRRSADTSQLGRTTVRIFSTLTGQAGDENYIGASLTVTAPNQSWAIDPARYLVRLNAGEHIHFAVHMGLFQPVSATSDGWGFDDTELAFDITRLVEFSANHTYADDPAGPGANQQYPIVITATDSGAPGTANLAVAVNNVAPALNPITVTPTGAGQVRVDGVFADASALDTFNVLINWGDGNSDNIPLAAAATTFSMTHTYSDNNGALAGQSLNYSIFASVTDDDGGVGSDTDTAAITFAGSVSFRSAPAASPNPAKALETVTFTAGANLSDAVITWDFGDASTTRTGQLVSHIYAAAGTYNVVVTATHAASGSSTQSTIQMVVTASGFDGGGSGGGGGSSGNGAAKDTDSDGYSDETESASGSSSSDANTTPYGLPKITTTQPLTLKKFQIGLRFTSSGGDQLSASGAIPIAAGFTVAGQKVLIDVGGVVRNFTLDGKGGAKSGTDALKMKAKGKKGVPATEAQFTLKIKGAFASALADEGLIDTTAKNDSKNVMFALYNGTTKYSQNASLAYTAGKGKGKAKK